MSDRPTFHARGEARPAAPGGPGAPIRVLVVDDSVVLRQAVRRCLEADPELRVVAVALDDLDALLKVEQFQPDVVTLDVEMPTLDELSALRLLMERFPRPVVMFSSLTAAGAEAAVRALGLGAVDFLCKPSGQSGSGMSAIAEELVTKVKRAARARVRATTAARPTARRVFSPAVRIRSTRPATPPAGTPEPDRLIVIGSSTGGPRALAELTAGLPGDLPCPVLIVQHLPAGFTRSLAERLDHGCALPVAEAQDGDTLVPGRVLVAPGDYHLKVVGRRLALDQGPRRRGVRPAIDTTLETATATFGSAVLTAILTGMGEDGKDGSREVRSAGGIVLAEAESTCVVYGMPRAVAEAGLSNEIVPLDQMASAIVRHLASLRPSAARRSA